MAFAFIQEWKDAAPHTDIYDAVTARLGVEHDRPEGLIAHTAGRDDNRVWRIFEIWDSREQAQRFLEERVMPIVMDLAQRPEDARRPDVHELYELHNLIRF